jgi:hypothetical protein
LNFHFGSMSRCLLVNPWIFDFAAYDFGAKPVGLLRIAGHLRSRGHEVALIDCLAGCAERRDSHGFSKIRKEEIEKPHTLRKIGRPYYRYGIPPSAFIASLHEAGDIDEIYVTSGMTYWYPGVQLAVELLREVFGGTKILLGGIYATLCYEHACAKSGATEVVRGDYPGNRCFAEEGFYPAYDLLGDRGILPLQLTRGCPFNCSYCASRLLTPRFEMKDPGNLFEELLYYHREFGTRTFVFYDDALAYCSDAGLKRFLNMVIDSGVDCTFYTPNGLHARFIDEELAVLLHRAQFKAPRISLETSRCEVQQATGGKVSTGELTTAVEHLKNAGFAKEDIGVYLMMGAEWTDMQKTTEDVAFINSVGAMAILASYSLIPGTQDYNELVERGTIEENMDPLWHNNTIFGELLTESYIEKVRGVRRRTAALNKQKEKESTVL